MKLYNVPKNTWVIPVYDDPTAPPGAAPVELGEKILFKHIDGMYSYCKNTEGKVVHLPAWQEVAIVEIDDANT